jgi:hypothetical protein
VGCAGLKFEVSGFLSAVFHAATTSDIFSPCMDLVS